MAGDRVSAGTRPARHRRGAGCCRRRRRRLADRRRRRTPFVRCPPVRAATRCRRPQAQPPERSAPVLLFVELCFGKQGGTPLLPGETYRYYIQVMPLVSMPAARATGRRTPTRWSRRFATTSSGCGIRASSTICRSRSTTTCSPTASLGRVVSYHIEERERIKTVRYDGSKQVDRTKIEEQLRERNLVIAADSFAGRGEDPPRVDASCRPDAREGLQSDDHVEAGAGRPGGEDRQSHLPDRTRGRRQKIKKVEFVGNDAFCDDKLARSR